MQHQLQHKESLVLNFGKWVWSNYRWKFQTVIEIPFLLLLYSFRKLVTYISIEKTCYFVDGFSSLEQRKANFVIKVLALSEELQTVQTVNSRWVKLEWLDATGQWLALYNQFIFGSGFFACSL